MKHIEKLTALIGPIASVLASTAYAQVNTGITPIQNTAGAVSVLCNIFDVMFWVLISVSIIMFLWAAYLYVFSGGNDEKPSQARLTVLYATFGIVAALLAKGAPALIASVFSQSVNGC